MLTLRRPRDPPRNYPANVDDFDVIGPDGKVIGRIFKPGGALAIGCGACRRWFGRRCAITAMRTRAKAACAAFRAAWEQA